MPGRRATPRCPYISTLPRGVTAVPRSSQTAMTRLTGRSMGVVYWWSPLPSGRGSSRIFPTQSNLPNNNYKQNLLTRGGVRSVRIGAAHFSQPQVKEKEFVVTIKKEEIRTSYVQEGAESRTARGGTEKVPETLQKKDRRTCCHRGRPPRQPAATAGRPPTRDPAVATPDNLLPP